MQAVVKSSGGSSLVDVEVRVVWLVVSDQCDKDLDHLVLGIVEGNALRLSPFDKSFVVRLQVCVVLGRTQCSLSDEGLQPRVALGTYMCSKPDGCSRLVLEGYDAPIGRHLPVVEVEIAEVVRKD